jgi:hypothetical protein
MKSQTVNVSLVLLLLSGLISCAGEPEVDSTKSENSTEQIEQEPTEASEPVSLLGNFQGLVGEWTVDAKTAGVKLDLVFNQDGSFKQMMGQVNGDGTWEVVDEEHVKIVTQNTPGQTWKISELTANSVNLCWNPDNPNPKTFPMERVK